jgi:hypothetical protein
MVVWTYRTTVGHLECKVRKRKLLGNPVVHEDGDLVRFDYGCGPSSAANFFRGQADRIRRQCATSIIKIGRALIEAGRHLSHGAFTAWIELEVGIPVCTAQAYMRIAVWAAGKGATVARLSPSALHLLSSSNMPDEFVEAVLRRVEAGEYISAQSLREDERRPVGGRWTGALSRFPRPNFFPATGATRAPKLPIVRAVSRSFR